MPKLGGIGVGAPGAALGVIVNAGLLRRSLGLHIQRRENDWVVPCLEGVDAPEAGMEVSAATSRELARAEINEVALALVSAGMK